VLFELVYVFNEPVVDSILFNLPTALDENVFKELVLVSSEPSLLF
jgi:hypothetical protein